MHACWRTTQIEYQYRLPLICLERQPFFLKIFLKKLQRIAPLSRLIRQNNLSGGSIMRYLFPILLLAASILLCICAAPSVVSTLYPAASVSGAITLPGTMLP